MGLELRDIKQMIMAGFKSSFLPFHVKQEYLRRVSAELQRYHEDGTVSEEPAVNSHPSRRDRAEAVAVPAEQTSAE
jgi:adenosine deaminase